MIMFLTLLRDVSTRQDDQRPTPEIRFIQTPGKNGSNSRKGGVYNRLRVTFSHTVIFP
jgi:hypothetical protein